MRQPALLCTVLLNYTIIFSFFLNLILFIVLFLLVTTIAYCTYFKNSKINKFLIVQSVTQKYDWLKLNHETAIEIIWTVVQSVLLLMIAIPFFALLYATNELIDPSVTIQIIGHQWYWSYEYNDITARDPRTRGYSIRYRYFWPCFLMCFCWKPFFWFFYETRVGFSSWWAETLRNWFSFSATKIYAYPFYDHVGRCNT